MEGSNGHGVAITAPETGAPASPVVAAPAPLLWRPISLLGLALRHGLRDPKVNRLWWTWLAACVLCIASSALLGRLPIRLGPLDAQLIISPPLILATLMVFWFGFEWGAIPAYLAAVALASVDGLAPQWAVLFSAAYPLGLAVYAAVYRTAALSIDLQNSA
ncbi:MAG: hypothetical protein ACRD96_01795, partial [Bryobacteraceae bacterium]